MISTKNKKRIMPPLRVAMTFQNHRNAGKSDKPVAKAVGKIQNELDKAKPSRYPNYLPELKAQRAKVIENSGAKSEYGSFNIYHNNLGFGNNSGLESLQRNSDRSRRASNKCLSSNYNEGHPLLLPNPSTIRRLPKEVLSLYRAPDKTINEWDIDSPKLAVDFLRTGLAKGPPISQLPSPVSSQAVLFDIKGHRRKDYQRQQEPPQRRF